MGRALSKAEAKLDRQLANGKISQSDYDSLSSALGSGAGSSVRLVRSINKKKNLNKAIDKAGFLNEALAYADENEDEYGQQVGNILSSGRKGTRGELSAAMEKGRQAEGGSGLDTDLDPTSMDPGVVVDSRPTDGGQGGAGPEGATGAPVSTPQGAVEVAADYYNQSGINAANAAANAQNPTVNEDYLNDIYSNRDDNLAYIDELFDLGYIDGTPGAEGEKYRGAYNDLLEQAGARGILDTSMTGANIQDLQRQLLQDKAAYAYDARNKSFDQIKDERNAVRDMNAGFVNLFGQEQGRALGNMIQGAIANGQLSLEQAKLIAELIQFEVVNRNNIAQQQMNNKNNDRAYTDQQRLYDEITGGSGGTWWNPFD